MAATLTLWLTRLCRAMEALVALLLAVLIAVNLTAVFFRYGLNDSLVWTEETLRYTMIWIAMVGGAAALFRNEHMGVDLLVMMDIPWLTRLVRAVILIIVGIFAVLLLWYAVPMAERNMAQVSPAARIPMVWPYLAVVVGAAGLLINALGSLALLALNAPPFQPVVAATPATVTPATVPSVVDKADPGAFSDRTD